MSAQSIDSLIHLKSWEAHRQAEQVIAALAADFPGLVQVGQPFEYVPLPTRRHPSPARRKAPSRCRRLPADELFRVVPVEEVSRILGFSHPSHTQDNWDNWVPDVHTAYLRELMREWPTLVQARDLLRKAYSLAHVAATLKLNKTLLADKLRAFKMDVPHVV
jgi:hypothetical protein